MRKAFKRVIQKAIDEDFALLLIAGDLFDSNRPSQRSVDLVAELNRRMGELVKRGVVLSDMGGPSYVYTQLNEIKPSMIAEATRNARKSAEQFAADSGSRIGKIRRARQGVFVVLPRDPAPGIDEGSQLDKTLRVVSTIDYYLED